MRLTVDGVVHELPESHAGESLLRLLRDGLGLTATKNACEQGECGSCTVSIDGELACACLVPAVQARDTHVETVAALAADDGTLHPVQEAFLAAGAVQCGFCTPGFLVATRDLLRRIPDPAPDDIRHELAGNLCRCTGYHNIIEAVRLAGPGDDPMSVTVITGCAIATVDSQRREFADGHLVSSHGRLVAVGPGPAPPEWVQRATRTIDARGRLATPGLINCHHHLCQWATRGWAQDATLFEWLTALYPVWEHLDGDIVDAAARAGVAALACSGATTTMDHHYVFPRDAGDLLGVEIGAAAAIGLRFHPCRGAMDLGVSDGGLPPDSVVEDRDAILQASADAIDRFHDPAPGSMLRIALAPTSPFTVTPELLTETAELARARGVRLHTHLAETIDEQEFCLERFGMRPMHYVEEHGWLGDDVWMAHCVHLDPAEARRMGETGTGVAHCPTSNGRLGAGIAPIPALLAAGAAVGLGVDGAASNEVGELAAELQAALVLARAAAGPTALTVRQTLEMATLHGARCLGRADELGHLSVGAMADIALWPIDELGQAGIVDPVVALVLGPTRPVDTLLVGGEPVVAGGELRTADPVTLAAELTRVARRIGGPA